MTSVHEGKLSYVIGKTKEDVLAAFLARGGEIFGSSAASHMILGKTERSALLDGTFLGWGIDASPVAERAVEWFIRVYREDPSPKPRIFYTCYAGTHTSVLAAWSHLGALDGWPLCEGDDGSLEDVVRLPLFDKRTSKEIGIPAFLGEDPYGTEVYAFGSGWHGRNLEMLIRDLIEITNPRARACLVNVRGFLDFPARLGGFLSRRLAVVSVGRSIIARSLWKRLPTIKSGVSFCLDLSRRWHDNGGKPFGEVLWIDAGQKRWTGEKG